MYLDVDELVNYCRDKLTTEGVSVSEELLHRIFELEERFMFEKGITDSL